MIYSLKPYEINTSKCRWPLASEGHACSPAGVQVFFASLNLGQHQVDNFFQWLSEEEVARADRYRFENDRNQFIAARGILRTLVGEYLHQSPGKIRFGFEANGKPCLSTAFHPEGLRFNLSHTQGAALFAFGFGRNIGVDIEKWGRLQYIDEMAQKFFTDQENEILRNVPDDDRQEVFLRFWTRKEAIIKAHGAGLSIPLDSIDVSFMGINGFTRNNKDEQVEEKGWYVTDLFPCPGFSSAFATDDDRVDIECFQFVV